MTLKSNIQSTGASYGHSDAVCGELAPYIAATGTTQATAALLRKLTRHIVTSGASNSGVIVPPGVGNGDALQYGDELEVTNATMVTIIVYPPLGANFLGSSVNVGISLVSNYSLSVVVDSTARLIPRYYAIASGSGSVSSVGLSAPASVFTVSGSPVTTTGTLALDLATQTAHYAWLGPNGGSPAQPTFRALVAADIPSLAYAPQTSGSSILSGNGSGGFSNVTIGANLSFSMGTLSATGAGTGTVTSVGLSLPGIITVSGSPVMSTGTLTGTLATQNANLVWAGPTSGGASAPTFRSLVSADIPANVKLATIFYEISGGGTAIGTGLKGYMQITFDCTIVSNTLLADQTGSIVVNIWKCTYSQFDASSTHPVAADKITSSTPPTISSAVKSTDSTLSSWTTAISAGDILAFNVDSCSTITRAELMLKVAKT